MSVPKNTLESIGHTPGPWVGGGRRGIDGGQYGCDEVVSAACDPCGWSGCSGARVVISEADERLIAAAPELLEACRRVLRDIAIQDAHLDEAVAVLTAAISKAEGRVK